MKRHFRLVHRGRAVHTHPIVTTMAERFAADPCTTPTSAPCSRSPHVTRTWHRPCRALSEALLHIMWSWGIVTRPGNVRCRRRCCASSLRPASIAGDCDVSHAVSAHPSDHSGVRPAVAIDIHVTKRKPKKQPRKTPVWTSKKGGLTPIRKSKHSPPAQSRCKML